MNRKIALIAALLACCAALPANAQRRAPTAAPPNPFLNTDAGVQQGGQVYDQNCTQCHGMGGGGGGMGPAIVSGTNPDVVIMNDGDVYNFIKNGVSGTVMPAFSGKLSDQDILKVTAYLHAMRGMAINSPTPGDPAHGEAVFFGKGQCASCHMINGKGSVSGPDLSKIAAIRRLNSITDALTKPLHHVFGAGGTHIRELSTMDTYPAVRATQANGKVIAGYLMNEDDFTVEIMGDDQQLHLLDRAKLRNVTTESHSAMPTDYDKRLAPDEFKDLLAFLTRQGPKTTATAAARPAPPAD